MTHRSSRLAAFALATCFGTGAQAATFIVGSGTGCTHGTIQSAINAANNAAGADTIRLTRSLTYAAEANTINTGQELTIEGGYATCTQASPDTTSTTVSGLGGAHAPVFTISAPLGALIRLSRLTISGGDVDGSGNGGGIMFTGDGIVEITDSLITQNIAGYGGGIFVKGTGSHTELVLGANTVVGNNTARYSGGGVYAQGVEMSMTDAGNGSIMLNKAQGLGGIGGYGGGVYVYAADRPSYAYIGTGAPIFGAIYGNQALYGGGVAVGSAGSDAAELQLFTTDPTRQAFLGYNTASNKGGGIHASNAKSVVRLWNAVIDNNDAPDGAAVYLASAAGFYANFAGMHPVASGCSVGTDCGRISNNVADTGSSPGAIIHGESGSPIQFGNPPTTSLPDPRGGMVIRDNVAGSVIDGAGATNIIRSIIGNNTTSSDLIKQTGQTLTVYDSTIAGNTIGGGSAILRTASSNVGIERAILWQPGSTSWSHSGGSLTIDRTDASENGSLGGGFAAYTFDPLFIDPAHGDYGLRAGSGAIDFAMAGLNQDRDAFGRLRNVDLPNADNPGTRDIGALERPAVLPLVLNGDFDPNDLRLWDTVTAGTTTRDATQNASGAANSGSAHVTRTNPANGQETQGVSQCIHLPAPGTYALNGWGRGTGSNIVLGDKARLRWEYRGTGGLNCNVGVPVASGWLDLSSSTTWHRPAQPALIEVTPADWGNSPSIKVILTAVETPGAIGSTNAWFDGITLDVIPANDAIFANGFD